jgi:hypothetical protein
MSYQIKIKCDICRGVIVDNFNLPYKSYKLKLEQKGKLQEYPNSDLNIDICINCIAFVKESLKNALETITKIKKEQHQNNPV